MALTRKTDGLREDEARWRPGGRLLSLLGIVNHLSNVERRWIDGGFNGDSVDRREEEFDPGPELSVHDAMASYRLRRERTDAFIRATRSMSVSCDIGAASISAG